MPRYIHLLILLTLLQIASCTKTPTFPIWNGSADTSWYTADTSATEFTITTAEQLAGIAKLVNDSFFFKGKTIRLGQNIMLNDTADWKNWESNSPQNKWLHISPRFDGTFDGNGFKVIGVYVNDSIEKQGLFKYLGPKAVIKNLGVVASHIKGEMFVGGLVGECYDCSISNSYFNGTVIGEINAGGLLGMCDYRCYTDHSYSTGTVTGNRCVGGLAGCGYNIITNSHSTSKVTGKQLVGGLVGVNADIISNSYFNGEVIGENYVGGIAGENFGAIIINSYFAGTVTGDSAIGGVVGRNFIGLVSNSYSLALVSGEYIAGGIAGGNRGEINNSYYAGKLNINKIVDCDSIEKFGFFYTNTIDKYSKKTSNIYYNKEFSDQSNACSDGDGKTTAEMKSKETFANWDFEETWGIDGKINNGYPHLLENRGEKIVFKSGKDLTINTSEQLAEFARLVNEGTDFKGKIITLGKDIMLNDTTDWQNWESNPPANNWPVIGRIYINNKFNGTFDGNGKVIGGIYINTKKNNQGLFRYLSAEGVIKNLGIVASYIQGGNEIGGLVMKNEGTISKCHSAIKVKGKKRISALAGTNTGTISESYSASTVTGNQYVGEIVGFNGHGIANFDSSGIISGSYSTGVVKGDSAVGGVAGTNWTGIISNSYSASEVTGKSRVGGLVGYNRKTIEGCYSNGNVTGEDIIGGLVGYNSGPITHSYSTGNVSGIKNVGGLAGNNIYASINNSYSIGKVSGTKNVGGFAGINLGAVRYSINNSYYNTQTSGQEEQKPNLDLGKTTEQMKQKETFEGWDFESVWGMDSTINNGYPYLR